MKRVRELKVSPATVAMDKGYDTQPVHDACRDAGCLPVIPLKATLCVKRGEHKPPTCEHGVWTFAGADLKRGMTKWRCPSAECKPASLWRKASRLHPLIPRDSKRFGDLYRGRGAVEREFGRLKHEWGLGPLRVRGIEKVQLHADLVILARLASASARARAVPLAAKPPRNEILAPEVELCLPRLLRLARCRASGDCGPSAGVLAAGPVTRTLLLHMPPSAPFR